MVNDVFTAFLVSTQRRITLCRKVFEMAISLALEVHSTKTRILETYLQTAYFGHGAFGIGHAASTYYQKMPQNLSLNEAALLAATLPSPETLSPFRDPEGSVKRLQKVLKAMHGMGYLSDAQLQTALAEGLPASLGARAQASTNPSLSKYSAGVDILLPHSVHLCLATRCLLCLGLSQALEVQEKYT